MEELDYKLSDQEEPQEFSDYYEPLDLSPEQKIGIATTIEANLQAIEEERNKDGCDNRWGKLDNQYWGEVKESADLLFNTHKHLTLTRCRRAKSRIFQAFFESDPVFSVAPRPGNAKKGGFEDAELQEQFLDYEVDTEMVIKDPIRKVFHESILKDGGIAKLIWVQDKEWVKVTEHYSGSQAGLDKFLKEYKDAREKYPNYVRKLEKGEDIDIVAEKEVVDYDAPKIYYLPWKNFWISLATEGLEGLRKSKFYAEENEYSYYELQEEVDEGRLPREEVEELKWIPDKEGVKIDPHYLQRKYHVFETNLYYPLEEGKDPVHIVVNYVRERKKVLSGIRYFYEHNRPYYIPFWITGELSGWHQPGLGRILTPANIIANATTNLTLDNAFYSHVPLLRVSPNAKNAVGALVSKTWRLGDPLIAEKNEVDKFDLKTGSLNDMMELGQSNEHEADEVSGVPSGYMSGKSDPLDPDAPASKTAMLIKEANINVKDYILCLLPSFQELAYQILQLFAQFRDTAQFQVKKKEALGVKKIFKEVNPEVLRLRTNITPNAYSFNFDKQNEKRNNLALVKFLTENPISNEFLKRAPKAQWNLFHILIKSWGDFWGAKVDEVWPTEKQTNEYMKEIQKQAFEEFYQEKVKQRTQQMVRQRPQRPQRPGQGAPARPQQPITGGM